MLVLIDEKTRTYIETEYIKKIEIYNKTFLKITMENDNTEISECYTEEKAKKLLDEIVSVKNASFLYDNREVQFNG